MSLRELVVISKDKYNALIKNEHVDKIASSTQTMESTEKDDSKSALDNSFIKPKDTQDNSFDKPDTYPDINTDNMLKVVRARHVSFTGQKKKKKQ